MKLLFGIPGLLLVLPWKQPSSLHSAPPAGGDSVWANDAAFITQKLLRGKFRVDIQRYQKKGPGACMADKLHRGEWIKEFEAPHAIGDISGDGKTDYVYVLQPLSRCEEGQSYYFSDPRIPRIETDSYCCHPRSLFSIGDIDEDGRAELGEYYSSCSSRFKAMTIWSLKGGRWKAIKSFSYVLNDQYRLFDDFPKLFRKVAKGKVAYRELSDVTVEGKLVAHWKTVTVQ